jgi:hypothetical protein
MGGLHVFLYLRQRVLAQEAPRQPTYLLTVIGHVITMYYILSFVGHLILSFFLSLSGNFVQVYQEGLRDAME